MTHQHSLFHRAKDLTQTLVYSGKPTNSDYSEEYVKLADMAARNLPKHQQMDAILYKVDDETVYMITPYFQKVEKIEAKLVEKSKKWTKKRYERV